MTVSKQLIQAAAGAGGESFWALRIGDNNASYDQRLHGIALDSLNNILVCGQVNNSHGYLAKISAEGEVQWQNEYQEGGAATRFEGVACDSNDNIYACGWANNNFGRAHLLKFNTSGVTQWSKYWNTTYGDTAYDVVIDSSDNIYFLGDQSAPAAVYKLNTNGSTLLSYDYTAQDLADFYKGALNNSETILYCAGAWRRTGQNFEDCGLFPIATSSLNDYSNAPTHVSSTRRKYFGVACDSNDNVFVMGSTDGGTTIAKYNSSHVLQNYVVIPNIGLQTAGYASLAIDSNDNVVAVGAVTSYSVLYVFDNALNTTEIAQRQITGMSVRGMTLDADDNIYLCGEALATDDHAVVKLPADYSGTGTYDFFTYAETTQTPTKPSITFGSINPTKTTTVSTVNSSMTETTSTLTETLTDI